MSGSEQGVGPHGEVSAASAADGGAGSRSVSSKAELVLTPPGDGRRTMVQRQAVGSFVTHPTVVEFTYDGDPLALRERWRADVGSPPCHMVVDASGTGEVPGPRVAADGGSFAVEGAHPWDLTGLCMKWQDALREARNHGDLFVTFDSVTALLQYVDLREAYRFLHTLVAGVHRVGARGQFYLDPEAHDDRTVSTVQGLFDSVRRLG
ncbi:DUF7504 family protein [Halobaculum lipolyticum]|uniref:DUF835 domain-containing protein n=1 Tax=Halobaculum lipolyticum TaxID=3032001 RepID=A0ABD5WAS1_9EURY|nr:hypothetical protein [Halobaculum sp. DT31]